MGVDCRVFAHSVAGGRGSREERYVEIKFVVLDGINIDIRIL